MITHIPSNQPSSAVIEPNRLSQATSESPDTNASKQALETKKPNQASLQWATVESKKELNTQQKQQLIELNPALAKTLLGQVKAQAQSTTLTTQNIALLKQSSLNLLGLKLNDTSIRMVVPENLSKTLNLGEALAIEPMDKGWKLATNGQLKDALHIAAKQLLNQNLPLQGSNSALFKIAEQLQTGASSVLSQYPKTQTQLQALTKHIIDATKTQNPHILKNELNTNLKPNTAIKQLNTLQQQLNQEALAKNTLTLAASAKPISHLENSLSQLNNVLKAKLPSINHQVFNSVSTVQNKLSTQANNLQGLTTIQLGNIEQANKAVLRLIETVQKSHDQTTIANIVSQQLYAITQSLGGILNNTLNTPANQAILQLLGIALHGQSIDQSTIQNKVQQQLKTLIEQAGAKSQIHQLRHLGLDPSKEMPSNIVQHLQGELSLRFNEQILPLTYQIQGFDEQETSPEDKEAASEKKEKTRRWQLFMSLDLPNEETLHCKITLTNKHIDTTLWAESATLCKTTQNAIDDLRERFTQAGLNVNNLQCFEGKPPQDDASVSYNLVDIST